MFPPMAKKVDMSHLEAHHHCLDSHLAKVIALGSTLKNVDDMKEFDQGTTTTLLKELALIAATRGNQSELVVCG